ncbi:MAG: hypothetical protein CME71_05180 [Halobacteriovorax sp.]|nr:hypothetical protein [Halobacteriovorax sp.]
MTNVKLRSISHTSFCLGEIYPYDVFLQVSEKKVIKIYEPGFEVTQADLDRLAKYPGGSILVTKQAHTQYFEDKLPLELKQELQNNKPVDIKKAEDLFCYALYREEGCSDQDFINDVMKKAQKISLALFDSEEQRKDKISNFNILTTLCKSEERFAAHSQLLLTLGSLFMMATPGVTMDYLTSIGHVAFLHGFAMEYLVDRNKKTVFHQLLSPQDIKIDIIKDSQAIKDSINAHFDGHTLKDFNAISAYLKHIYIMEKAVDQSSFSKNAGTVRTIKEFKSFETPVKFRIESKKSNYFVVTKKFVIVDHLVTILSKKLQEATSSTEDLIASCLTTLKNKLQDNDAVYDYDQELLDTFIKYSRTIS